MPKQNQAATEVQHSQEVLAMSLKPGDEPAKVLKPSKQPFDFPAPMISAQTTPIFGFVLANAAVRFDYFDSVLS
jgi:hypothetical protein